MAAYSPSDTHDEDRNQAVNEFLHRLNAFDAERQAALEAGVPALGRLAKIAGGDTGQASKVRRFLLGLYNGPHFPFDLTELRGLDKQLFEDSMTVLRLDARATIKEVHQYFTNGSDLFEKWAKLESKR